MFCPFFLVAPDIIQFIRDGGVLTDFDMAYPTLVKDILYFETASFVFDIILLWACAKLKPRETPYALKDLDVVDMTPWRFRWPVIILTFVILAGMYALFSPIGLGG